MQVQLPRIVAVGIYNSQLAHKTTFSPNRKTTMFELELPLDDSAISYIDEEQRRSSPSTVICAKPGQMRHSRLPYKCYYVHMIVGEGSLLEKLMQLPNFVEFSDSDSVELLESVVVIGNANGKGISATAGYISVDSEYINILASDDTTTVEMRVMRTSAPINSGNSGGGMFNAEGKLLGITNAKIVDGQTDNIGFAIPANIVKYVSENIMYYCDGKQNQNVMKCIIGIDLSIISSAAVYDETTGKVSKQEAVAVKSITQNGIANGILQAGDVINKITIDGVEYVINRKFNIIDCMINARVGSAVVINITRNGAAMDVTIEITDKALTKIA